MNNKKILLSSLLVLGILVMSIGFVSVTDTQANADTQQLTATVCGLMTNTQASGNNPGKKCNEAFKAANLCNPGETAELQSCTVPQPPAACTNGNGRSGYECECNYTCKKNPITPGGAVSVV